MSSHRKNFRRRADDAEDANGDAGSHPKPTTATKTQTLTVPKPKSPPRRQGAAASASPMMRTMMTPRRAPSRIAAALRPPYARPAPRPRLRRRSTASRPPGSGSGVRRRLLSRRCRRRSPPTSSPMLGSILRSACGSSRRTPAHSRGASCVHRRRRLQQLSPGLRGWQQPMPVLHLLPPRQLQQNQWLFSKAW